MAHLARLWIEATDSKRSAVGMVWPELAETLDAVSGRTAPPSARPRRCSGYACKAMATVRTMGPLGPGVCTDHVTEGTFPL